MKIKIFQTGSEGISNKTSLETAITKWLKNNHDITIVSTNQSTCLGTKEQLITTFTIIYK